MLALIERYPALEQCYQDTVDSYDDLIKSEPVEFHAAYIANLEATFTPLFKVFLDNRDALFGGGDRRVASLMMWHFVEEIEHRSSGSAPVPPPVAGSVVSRQTHPGDVPAHQRFVGEDRRGIRRTHPVRGPRRLGTGIDVAGPAGRRVQVPRAGWNAADGPDTVARPRCSTRVPTGHLAKMVWRLALSQTPNHDPADQPLPEWADTWMREYDRGTDMTAFFGAPPTAGNGR